jgi:tricorn protease
MRCGRNLGALVGIVLIAGAGFGNRPARGDVRPHAGMLMSPDVSATHIVFSYANDLWVVPREGGVAEPLASPPGVESFPRFSPDGQTIAFMANYDGNSDLYTLPVAGGVPFRVTHHPTTENLCDWLPDGRLIFFSNCEAPFGRMMQLFTVAPTGGLPEKLPVPYGANAAISPDGRWLAYTLHTTDNRTWKRYCGGMATDIWLFNLKDRTAERVTQWEGTDSQPMWHGKMLYYMSDKGPEHRLNIWSYDRDSKKRKQVTHFAEFDIKWPAIGPGPDGQGEIVLQNGTDLYLLDLASEQTRVVDVTIPGDRPKIRPQLVDVSDHIRSADISPTGKRAVMEARGDIWTAPARHGSPRNLTRTAGVHERYPSWSPDGRWIAYWSDASDENELYLVQSDGKAEPRKLTNHGPGFRYGILWSPDSKYVAYGDNAGNMYLRAIDKDESKLVDTDPDARVPQASWSPDSRWIAYTKRADSDLNTIWLYNVETGEKHQLTSELFNSTSPTFDRKGDYLYFATNRDTDTPIYSELGESWVYANTEMLCVVPLRAEVGSPWAPKSDEEKWGEAKEKAEKEEKEKEEKKEEENKDEEGDHDDEGNSESPGTSQPATASSPASTQAAQSQQSEEEEQESKQHKKKEPKPVEIEIEGFEARAVPLPLPAGNFSNLAVNDKGHLLFVRRPLRGSDGKPAIKIFDVKDDEKKEKTVLEDVGGFDLSANGKKILVRKGDSMAIVDARPDQKMDKPMPLSGMMVSIDPRVEWGEVFTEAWRIMRDFFYVPNMHGVDWPGMRARYGKMLDDCVSREDVTFVIKEMISELNVGHAYYWASDPDKGPSVSVGLLGADFELCGGAYRISKICSGGPWDLDGRGPLSQPGVKVKEGDYLLAVNGLPLDSAQDPWAAFQGMAGRTVVLTVSDKPTLDDDAHDVVVKLLRGEHELRYRAWIEAKRAYVDEKSDGKIGYIYVPNTGRDGQADLVRQFQGQRRKQALIIDERWNGGGQIPDRFIELLNRPLFGMWVRRHGQPGRTPDDSHQGPKCMLINGLAGSGGDAFPEYFRKAGLGKLIGTRTWGGLVGISGNPEFVDGRRITVPTFGAYNLDSTWQIEGHGVDPDIEVIDDPSKMTDGGDPQLDTAIALMLEEIGQHGFVEPPPPPAPDRSGMGQ